MVKENLFSTMFLDHLIIHIDKNEHYPFLTPHTKINSKRIKSLSVKPKLMKFLEENIRENACGLGEGKGYLDRTRKV